ncbi:MAG: alpha/beta hydrolase [Waterburya sp.]
MKHLFAIHQNYIFNPLTTISLGLSVVVMITQPAFSAEKITLIYGPFNGDISVKSLEKYATTGEITDEFRLYAKFLDKKALIQLRNWLNNRFQCDRVKMYEFTNTSEGEKFLQELGSAIKTHPERNGFYAIRSALIEAADTPDNSDGWTIIEAMHNFPTEDLQINTKDLFELQKFWSNHNGSHQTALETFKPQSQSSQ